MKEKLYDVALTDRGPNPINLMKSLRQIAGDNMAYATMSGSLKDAKAFVDAVRARKGISTTLLRGVPYAVGVEAKDEILAQGALVTMGRSETNMDPFICSHGRSKVLRCEQCVGEGAYTHAEFKNYAYLRGYGAGDQTIRRLVPNSPFTMNEFQAHIMRLLGYYAQSAADDDKDWLAHLGSLEGGAVDFAKFVQALDGEVEEKK